MVSEHHLFRNLSPDPSTQEKCWFFYFVFCRYPTTVWLRLLPAKSRLLTALQTLYLRLFPDEILLLLPSTGRRYWLHRDF